MDSIAPSSLGTEDQESELVDVTSLPLHELLLPSDDDTALAQSLRRILSEMDYSQEIIAAFGSYVR